MFSNTIEHLTFSAAVSTTTNIKRFGQISFQIELNATSKVPRKVQEQRSIT